MRAGAIIVAAGSGERLGAGMPKAFVRVAGLPLVSWSMRALDAAPSVGPVVIVAPPGAEREMAAAIGSGTYAHAIVPGGSSRQRSVAAGIARPATGLGQRAPLMPRQRPAMYIA